MRNVDAQNEFSGEEFQHHQQRRDAEAVSRGSAGFDFRATECVL